LIAAAQRASFVSMDDPKVRATERAIRTACAVTLGLAIGASVAGCEPAADYFCRVWDQNRYCCERGYGTWDTTARTCRPPVPVPGPFVPPDLPA
jgi:hypothetical protein